VSTQGAQMLELELERDGSAPARARAAVRARFAELEVDTTLSFTLALLVSELVSNAVLHSLGPPDAPIVLSASATRETISVSVTDAGKGFSPVARPADRAVGGFGLELLARTASRWGVDSYAPTRVWFELSRAA